MEMRAHNNGSNDKQDTESDTYFGKEGIRINKQPDDADNKRNDDHA